MAMGHVKAFMLNWTTPVRLFLHTQIPWKSPSMDRFSSRNLIHGTRGPRLWLRIPICKQTKREVCGPDDHHEPDDGQPQGPEFDKNALLLKVSTSRIVMQHRQSDTPIRVAVEPTLRNPHMQLCARIKVQRFLVCMPTGGLFGERRNDEFEINLWISTGSSLSEDGGDALYDYTEDFAFMTDISCSPAVARFRPIDA
ncbi:hypothetical protein B0T17DRAFT_510270 [Bombardia bombarda]|uniref:Uncharacterized protein n=1 Tax=Bombardia bombarda TaxID=252184 RepID=A0AA39WHU6_9PEZI|nr:hypothetical protein B0T17DRAFT_510270 [Bombardia bombarda]